MADVRVVAPVDALAVGGASVKRAFPQRGLGAVGPWVFADAVGPATGFSVPAHLQAGVQTLTWLLAGRLRYTDGLGTDLVAGPGRLVLVTAGSGLVVAQSAVGDEPVRGLAAGLLLPAASRLVEPSVEEFSPEPVRVGDHEVAIIVGEFGFEDSPVTVHADAVAAEVRFASDEPLAVDAPPGWEYAVLAGADPLTVDGAEVAPGGVAVVTGGSFAVRARASAARLVPAMVLGGAPLHEPVVPWWGLYGGSHDQVAGWLASWEDALAGRGPLALPPGSDAATAARIPAPGGRLVARVR